MQNTADVFRGTKPTFDDVTAGHRHTAKAIGRLGENLHQESVRRHSGISVIQLRDLR